MDQPDNIRSSAAINFFCAAFIVLVTLVLVSQLGSQTRWVKRADLVMQPGFFPTVGLMVMGMPALSLRVGIRGVRWMVTAVLIGLVIVLLFRTGLQVRLPDGYVYGYLPPEMRNFMIRNF